MAQKKSKRTRLRRILDWIFFIFTMRGPIADEAVDEGIVDYSGQGRDKYGR